MAKAPRLLWCHTAAPPFRWNNPFADGRLPSRQVTDRLPVLCQQFATNTRWNYSFSRHPVAFNFYEKSLCHKCPLKTPWIKQSCGISLLWQFICKTKCHKFLPKLQYLEASCGIYFWWQFMMPQISVENAFHQNILWHSFLMTTYNSTNTLLNHCISRHLVEFTSGGKPIIPQTPLEITVSQGILWNLPLVSKPIIPQTPAKITVF